MSKPDLLVAPCSYKAAKYATNHWHYTGSMPMPPIVKFGVWENNVFIGSVLFSRGSNKNLGSPYNLQQTEICELSRIALNTHVSPVSQILKLSMKQLKHTHRNLRLIVSFADANESHLGVVYQASNWIYAGKSKSTPKYRTPDGQILHQRQVSKTGFGSLYGKLTEIPKIDECEAIEQLDKYRYLYPLDKAMRKQIEPLAQPYPKAE